MLEKARVYAGLFSTLIWIWISPGFIGLIYFAFYLVGGGESFAEWISGLPIATALDLITPSPERPYTFLFIFIPLVLSIFPAVGFCKNMYQHCLTNAAMPRKSVWRLLLGVFGMVFPVFTIYYFARFYAKGDLRQAYCVDSGADGYSDQIHGSSDLPDCAPGVEAGAPARSKRFPFDFTRQRIALLALLVFNISIARLAWNSGRKPTALG